jgi:hypothetical protein
MNLISLPEERSCVSKSKARPLTIWNPTIYVHTAFSVLTFPSPHMHSAALIKLVQEIATWALINFSRYMEVRRSSVKAMQTRNVRTLKLSKVGYAR